MNRHLDRPLERSVGRLLAGCTDFGDNPMADDSRAAVDCGDVRRVLQELGRQEALQDIAFARGVEAGWNCETAEQRERLTASLRAPALAELKRLRELPPNG